MYLQVLRNFRENIESLQAFVTSVEPVLRKSSLELREISTQTVALLTFMLNKIKKCKTTEPDEEEQKVLNDVEKYLEDEGILDCIEYAGDTVKIKSTDNQSVNFEQIGTVLNSIKIDINKVDILYKSALMSLVVYLESMFAELFRISFSKYPDSIVSKKTLSFEEIIKLGSLDEARDYLIEKEIESMMYKSFDDWCKYFKDKHSMKMDYLENDRERLTEIICRRNLFVHNGGVVNNIYISKVNPEQRIGIEKGKKLKVDSEYVNEAIEVVYRIGCLIILDIWRKSSNDISKMSDYILSTGYNFMREEKWQTSAEIYKLIIFEKRVDFKTKLTAKINYWQSIKWQGEYNQIKKEVDGEDFSAYSSEFQLCLLAIKDDVDNFFKLLPTVCPNNISFDDFKTWPVFKEIRKDSKYMDFMIENGISLEKNKRCKSYKLRNAHSMGYTIKPKSICKV